jgi:hypothetical protein
MNQPEKDKSSILLLKDTVMHMENRFGSELQHWITTRLQNTQKEKGLIPHVKSINVLWSLRRFHTLWHGGVLIHSLLKGQGLHTMRCRSGPARNST